MYWLRRKRRSCRPTERRWANFELSPASTAARGVGRSECRGRDCPGRARPAIPCPSAAPKNQHFSTISPFARPIAPAASNASHCPEPPCRVRTRPSQTLWKIVEKHVEMWQSVLQPVLQSVWNSMLQIVLKTMWKSVLHCAVRSVLDSPARGPVARCRCGLRMDADGTQT